MKLNQNVQIRKNDFRLMGILNLPDPAKGLVIFAHGSGSSRLSPRNQQVATWLHEAGFATLLFDLLTSEESQNRANVFDIPLLGTRLNWAVEWVRNQEWGKEIRLGYFGASTGAGAALWSAADLRGEISAIVSRGGRPDLAMGRLDHVVVPTLLIVGGNDDIVIPLNRDAQKHMARCELLIVPGASHLFEEPGTLEQVAEQAIRWFNQHLLLKLGHQVLEEIQQVTRIVDHGLSRGEFIRLKFK